MKRRILLVIAIILILIGLTIFVRILANIVAPKGNGGLQVTSSIKGEVFLNGKKVGSTPLCLCDGDKTLVSGTYDIKIVPNDTSLSSFNAKVTINPNVLTAVDRVFLPGALSSSYILTLEKTNDPDAAVFISSIPDNALITIDGESEGVTPVNLKKLSPSEHEVEIEKIGFAKKTIRIRAVNGFRLVVNAILGTENDGSISSVSPTPTKTEEKEEISPSPKTTSRIEILSTPNGFLRVRSEPSISSAEIGRVNTGDIFDMIEEDESWYKITLPNGQSGWVSKSYSKLSNE